MTCQKPAQGVLIEGWDEIWEPRAILAWPLFSPAGCRMPGEIFPEIQLVYTSCMVLNCPSCARLFKRELNCYFQSLSFFAWLAFVTTWSQKRCLALEVYFLSTFFGDENKQVCVVAALRTSTWFQYRELQHHFLHMAAVGVEMQSLRLLSEAPTCWKKCVSSCVVNHYLV